MSQYEHPEVLVETEWLAQNLDDEKVRVVEVDVDTAAFDEGHIPGAVGWNWQRQLCDPVQRDIASKEQLEGLLGESGIDNDTTIVLYGDNNNWFACWAFWQLKIFGHADVRILNGGRRKWLAEGQPLTQEVAAYATASYEARDPDLALRAYLRDVLEHHGESEWGLVDTRSSKEYTGEILAPPGLSETCQRGGHIPSAVNVPWNQNCNDDGTFKSRDELEALYLSAGMHPGRTIITYCSIGERSSLSWFVIRYLLGWPAVLNYDGSWTEWGNLVGVPIATGDDPG